MGVDADQDWCCDLGIVLLDTDTLQSRIDELARELAAEYADRHPLVVGVLTGSFVFMADLVRRLAFPLEVEFIRASSYGDNDCSSGEVKVSGGLCRSVRGRHVLLVEDIVDSGRTLAHLREVLGQEEPASLAICCLLDKPERREVELSVEYCGFEIPNEFVVGYGLDYAGRFRHLPYVAILKPEAYQGQAE